MIGIGALHSKHGYEGLADAAEHLNMTVPLLALDVRKRDIKDDENVIENWEFKEKQLEKAMEADRKMCLQSGMDGYLKKPVALDDIESELRAHVSSAA